MAYEYLKDEIKFWMSKMKEKGFDKFCIKNSLRGTEYGLYKGNAFFVDIGARTEVKTILKDDFDLDIGCSNECVYIVANS
ncbi:MAG: hypothetical protein HQK50_13615 [Oligoflexia bacterium]|nr:hypothetical protein [Oligoflexia bacterium]